MRATRSRRWTRLLAGACAAAGLGAGPTAAGELLYATEGNRLRRIDVDSIDARPLAEDVLIEAARAGETGPARKTGRDVNGMICALPDGSGGFVLGEDTDQPTPPPGWGVFDAAGEQIGKLTATYFAAQAEPFGCAFAPDGTLFTTEVGDQDLGGASQGQLILWFPDPVEGFATFPGPPGAYPNTNAPSPSFCKIATDLQTAAGVAIDDLGRVYVAEASGLASGVAVERFSPPFPTGLGPGQGCEARDPLGSPIAETVQRDVAVPQTGLGLTATGLAFTPEGHLYVASVLNGRIAEFDALGRFVRWILVPPRSGLPKPTGSPQGIALGGDGTLYYADLNLVASDGGFGPGPNGGVWRIRFDERGDPLPPDRIRDELAFPDGVAIFPGNLERTQWRTFAGGPRRQFMNAGEAPLGPHNVGQLEVRWRFDTRAIITGSPSVAALFVPGEGIQQVAYFQSWDEHAYAVRVADGRELWRFETELAPGATFPQSASAHVERVGNRDVVLIPSGEILYALDALSGEEIWRFAAGTGCRDANGDPPGLCAFDGERNEIESSPIVVGGDTVVFGMDVNDREAGKGGFYGVDVHDGRMRWFFDLESGGIQNDGFVGTRVCRPFETDEIRRFDGYHSETELGLPAGFFASRPGCDFDRARTGCGNVWSSAAVDEERGLLFFASSNCDTLTAEDPLSGLPPPPMPLFDEAIVALHFDGTPAWSWRPREVDNDDLAFGAAPNLFSIDLGAGTLVDVLGVGNKDGTYYVLDRDGVNERNGVRWSDADSRELPYWTTRVVPGGDAGGIIATAAVDETARRVYFGTAPGGPENTPSPEFPLPRPQQPAFHALDLDTGEIVWQHGTVERPAQASFSPTSAIPGMVLSGGLAAANLRAFDTRGDAGVRLRSRVLSEFQTFSAVASGAVVIDGTLLVGQGIGARDENPAQVGDTTREPLPLVALCVPGTPGCVLPACNDGIDNDGDGRVDAGLSGDPGCVDDMGGSEVLGDLDFDGDVDEADRTLFVAALGSSRGDAAFRGWADYDRDDAITFLDYQDWLAALRAFQRAAAPSSAGGCGLLGVEILPVAWLAWRLGRRRT